MDGFHKFYLICLKVVSITSDRSKSMVPHTPVFLASSLDRLSIPTLSDKDFQTGFWWQCSASRPVFPSPVNVYLTPAPRIVYLTCSVSWSAMPSLFPPCLFSLFRATTPGRTTCARSRSEAELAPAGMCSLG